MCEEDEEELECDKVQEDEEEEEERRSSWLLLFKQVMKTCSNLPVM